MKIFFAALALITVVQCQLTGQEHAKADYEYKSGFGEQIVVWTDRKYYITEEMLWFNIFCHKKNNATEPGISRVVYLEIGHPAYGTVIQEKIKLDNGLASGGIKIPKEILNGHYYLRAYTNITRLNNNSDEYLDVITLINPEQNLEFSDSLSGNVHNPIGNEKSNNEIEQVILEYLMNPDKLIIKTITDSIKRPASISVSTLENKLLIKKPVYSKEIELFPDEMEEGILKIKFADNKGTLITESLIFWKPTENKPSNSILVDKKSGEQTLEINLNIFTNQSKAYVTSNLNIICAGANYSPDYLPAFALTSVSSLNKYLQAVPYISTDVAKQIRAYLHAFPPENNIKHLQKINHQSDALYIPETRGVNITGKVINNLSNSLLKEAWVMLTVLNDSTRIQYYKTNEDGRFVFSLEHLYGKHSIALVAFHDSVNKISILVDKDFDSGFENLPEIPFSLNQQEILLIRKLYLNHQVQKAYNISVSRTVKNPSLNRQFGYMDYTFVLSNYIKLPTLTEIINEIVVNVRVSEVKGEKMINIWDNYRKMYYHEPLILLDNLPVSDINALLKIKPDEIEKISVINQTYYLGNKQIRGILTIDTKERNYGNYQPVSNVVFLEYQTFLEKNVFFIEQNKKNLRMPLFLTTLIWKELNPEKDAKIGVPIPSNSGKFELLLRGINENGKKLIESRRIFLE